MSESEMAEQNRCMYAELIWSRSCEFSPLPGLGSYVHSVLFKLSEETLQVLHEERGVTIIEAPRDVLGIAICTPKVEEPFSLVMLNAPMLLKFECTPAEIEGIIAHEFGHIYLGHGTLDAAGRSVEDERQADEFALRHGFQLFTPRDPSPKTEREVGTPDRAAHASGITI